MGELYQCVKWNLRYPCPFRQGQASVTIDGALAATRALQALDRAETRGDVLGDVCIVGVSCDQGRCSPSSGFRVSDAVAAVGGFSATRQECGQCPANAWDKLAGCCGAFYIPPDDRGVQRALKRAIRGKATSDAFAKAFGTPTGPIYYGLWMRSPLSRPQLEILQAILPHLSGRDEGVSLFIEACRRALRNNLEVQVRMEPPGHVDPGPYLRRYVHCPRCKKFPESHWKDNLTGALCCRTCGFSYAAIVEPPSRWENPTWPELESLLSPEEYQAVCSAWKQRREAKKPAGEGGRSVFWSWWRRR